MAYPPVKPGEAQNRLRPDEARFVSEFLRDANAARAARATWPDNPNASSKGYNLTNKNKRVMLAISEARKGLVKKGAYNLERAMNEARIAMKFAKETNNANAYVKAIEHRAKLNGLLVEKVDVRHSGFQIQMFAFGSQPPPPQLQNIQTVESQVHAAHVESDDDMIDSDEGLDPEDMVPEEIKHDEIPEEEPAKEPEKEKVEEEAPHSDEKPNKPEIDSDDAQDIFK